LVGALAMAVVLAALFVLAVFVEPQPLTRRAGAATRQMAR
jgi:hypothetical protein